MTHTPLIDTPLELLANLVCFAAGFEAAKDGIDPL